MPRLLVFILVLAFAANANATALELGNRPIIEKSSSHVGQNPGTPDGREGGETVATAVPIPGLPFTDTGNTADNIDDYEVMCPYGSNSPDVVYSYTPLQDEEVWVDLCGSGYDTKIFILDEALNVVACNDDYYFDDLPCGNYVSFIEYVLLNAGQTYYIVVDGYSGDSGDYLLVVDYVNPVPPCDLVCAGVEEGEPPLEDGYNDIFNSGCGGADPDFNFSELWGDQAGDLTFCGRSGWYSGSPGYEDRDTDWFFAVIGPSGVIGWTLDAEEELYGFLLGPNNCADVLTQQIMTAGPCAPATMTITGDPGQLVWLWTGPTEFSPPFGFEGNEFGYVSTFTGLAEGVVATQRTTFGEIKSLFR